MTSIRKRVTYEQIRSFFRRNIAQVNTWPYLDESVITSLLPEYVSENYDKPAMPWYTEANDDYFEFRRPAFWMVSGIVFMAVILLLLSLSMLAVMITSFIEVGFSTDLIFLYIACSFFGFLILPSAVLIVFFTPHNLPIRFNRKTGRVYISNVILYRKHFFLKTKLIFQVMEWKDVQGWLVNRSYSHNTPYFGLHLVEDKYGEVGKLQQACVYRTGAPWSTSEMKGQINYIMSIWSYCQHYMAFKEVPNEAEKSKKFVFLPNNWLFKWPAAMDQESRSSVRE